MMSAPSPAGKTVGNGPGRATPAVIPADLMSDSAPAILPVDFSSREPVAVDHLAVGAEDHRLVHRLRDAVPEAADRAVPHTVGMLSWAEPVI